MVGTANRTLVRLCQAYKEHQFSLRYTHMAKLYTAQHSNAQQEWHVRVFPPALKRAARLNRIHVSATRKEPQLAFDVET